jgi:hypothetical protein
MKTFSTFYEGKAASILSGKNNGKTLVDKNEQFWIQHLAVDGSTIGVFCIDEQGNAREQEILQQGVLFYGPHISELYMFIKNGHFYKAFFDELVII